MGAFKKGVIPINFPLMGKCTRVNFVLWGLISQLKLRNFGDSKM